MSKPLAIQFGAGNIGRGFIGWLLKESGYDLVFADVNDQLVKEINQQQTYTVILANEAKESFTVTDVSAVNSQKQDAELTALIKQATLITTAVGPTILPLLAPSIAAGLEERKASQRPLSIIACENMIGGSEILQEAILPLLSEEGLAYVKNFVHFPNSAVDRIVPDQHNDNPLTVMVEPFYEWVVEIPPTEHELFPTVTGMKQVRDLTPYIERKLFTVNTGHAVTAYYGYMKEIASIEDAIHNDRIVYAVRSALEETGALLEKKFAFSHKEHQEYIDKIIERFKNPYISDYVVRVGRSPIRKISENDRFVRPAKQFVEAFNEVPKGLSNAIAAALLFTDPDDQEAQKLQLSIKEKGLDQTITAYTGIPPYSMLFEKVKESYELMV
ncbi:mannitol-1-phosphate 5-dehydrogenase [Vagococcus salmoninarum]|uniref:mannitol-1-phosphate 5-dehydrogenase n=1 Tax=Vagococcus salmoninarum TaxID=2739 RepID=UPI001880952A|nr:mannitol-1-phosphate 5-dehydrogenase [Vagococcus salmoninarum]MBE9388122.1 mannitol-1-phosphate 5-dehydrogenase [Vagococcus salmoninarum]